MSLITHSDKQVVPLWINGSALPIEPTRLFPVINAASDKTIHYAQGASTSDATAAASAALAAFPTWSRTSHSHRRAIISRFADLLETHADELAALQAAETSAPASFGQFITQLSAECQREIAGSMLSVLSGSIPPSGAAHTGEFAFTTKEAIGPVLVIPPWNAPTILGPRGISSALAAGCTVVLKAAELCPRLYLRIVELFTEAGLPSGVLNMVQARREDAASVTEALVAHPAIRKIDFIGSAGVGRIIGQLTSKHLKPIHMELGGKGPLLVLKDANLGKAARTAAFGAFMHHGQICMSTERILVQKEVADEFADLLRAEVERGYAKGGAGSAATKAFADKSAGMLEEAKKKGAGFLVGDGGAITNGATNGSTGQGAASLRPTILTGVTSSMSLYDDESFGPSASLYAVDGGVDALVEQANASAYGLAAAVWTEDTMLALDVARRLQYGIVNVNAATIGDVPSLPVGGWKASGWGSTNAGYGVGEYLVNKTVVLHRADEEDKFGK